MPAALSSAERSPLSVLVNGGAPSKKRTLHFPQSPSPPQGVSMCNPATLAASKTVAPLGTSTALPSGSKRTFTFSPLMSLAHFLKLKVTRINPLNPGN